MTEPTTADRAGFPGMADCQAVFAGLTSPASVVPAEQIPGGMAPVGAPKHEILPLLPTDPKGQGEPTAPVTQARVEDLAAYWAAGWPQALPVSMARVGALDRLAQAQAALPPGFGLAVFDAWRPLDLQAGLHHQAYDGTNLEPGYVNLPSTDPAKPPPHLTGGTFDLTLTWQGQALALGTHFDEFTERAHTAALEASADPLDASARVLRRLLAKVMTEAGFAPYFNEWWHWEYGTGVWAAWTGRSPIYGPAPDPRRGSGS